MQMLRGPLDGAVPQQALPREMLAGVLGIDKLKARDRLSELSQLLRRRDGGNALFHQSLADWLSAEETSGAYWTAADDGHAILAGSLWQRHRDGDLGDYGLWHTVAHLVAAEQWDHLESTLTDLSFLEAKSRAGLVFDLAADLTAGHAALPVERPHARILRLLDQALRTDLHFPARHPSTLFQCLWNRAWWYDCDEAANHSDPAEGGWEPQGPPWERDEARLCTLIERWPEEKEAREAGFVWVRSLRPPPTALGGAQIVCLRGQAARVSSVAISPRGRWIVSRSNDQTVRVWDANSGEGRRIWPHIPHAILLKCDRHTRTQITLGTCARGLFGEHGRRFTLPPPHRAMEAATLSL